MTSPQQHRPPANPFKVVVVGSGFAGFFAARRLRNLSVDVTILATTDSFLYAPLLPDVAVGTVDPRSVMVPLASTLRGTRIIRGHADRVDLTSKSVHYTTSDGEPAELGYSRLLLARAASPGCYPSPAWPNTPSG